jgi:hypothetical protein
MRVEARVVGHAEIDPNDFVTLDHAQVCGADYSGRKLEQFCTVGSRLESCRFDNVRIDDTAFGAGREMSEFINCSFDGAHMIHGAGFVRFVRCSFRDVDLRDWLCFKTEFIDCTFTGRMRTCIFNGTVPEDNRAWVGRERNDFRGNDFSGMELIDVAFRTGIDLDQQILPSGLNYLYVPDAVAAIERAERGLANWLPGSELQRQALIFMHVYADTVSKGQRQLLIHLPSHLKGPGKTPRESLEKVVELFKSFS